MKKYRKILSGILIISMFVSCATSNVLAANTDADEGGSLLREMYESSITAESENNMPTTQQIKEDEAAAKSLYLDDVMKVNAEYAQYYGGSYLDDGELVVLLTDTSDSVKTFINDTIGNVSRYEKCDVSLQQLKAIKEVILNYWSNYVEGANKELNELVDSIVSIGTYVDQNVVYIDVVECNDDKIRLFKENIIDSEHVFFECSNGSKNDSDTLNPGHAIGVASSISTHSMGFRCKKLKSDGTYAYGFVTSAHGTTMSATVYYIGYGSIGYIFARSYSNNGTTDAAFVYVTNSDYVPSNSTFYGVKNCSRYVQNVAIRTEVYKDGYKTGRTIGVIRATDASLLANNVITNDMYKASYNADGGDSGGIVYVESGSYYATIGIHRGREGAYSFVVKITNILSDLNVVWY